MGVIAWLVLGLISAFVASTIVNRTGEGLVMDLVLGIVGAVVVGFVFNRLFGATGVASFNLYSMFVAVVGAMILLLPHHTVARRRV